MTYDFSVIYWKHMAVYLLYGKSGSGKGTQAQILKDQLESNGRSVIWVETGKLFRDFIQKHSDFVGNRVSEIVNNGKLMPPFFPIYLWADQLVNQYDGTQDIIFDGVSRLIDEAPILDSALDFLNIQERNIIYLDVSDQWVFDHMGKRTDRADDTIDGMTARLAWFETQVIPVIDYFKQNKKYTTHIINGEQSIEQVAEEIQKVITQK